MPGFTVHYVLDMRAYNDTPQNNLKFIIAKYRQLHQLSLQGPDMFSYNLPILYHRDHHNADSYMYEHHVNCFLRCCLMQLSRVGSRQQREEGLAYMHGFTCHYVGDSICRPYVYGRIEYNVNHPGSYYHGFHVKLENGTDVPLLQKYKRKKPSQSNQATTIYLNGMETQFISQFPSDYINEAFYPLSYKNRYQVTASMIHHSILVLRFGRRILSDPNSRKKDRIAFFEFLLLENPVALSKLVTDAVGNPAWSLNLHYETWCNSWDKSVAFKPSFPNLFRQSLEKLSIIFYMINSMLETGQPLKLNILENLLPELGNYPCHSELLCAGD